MKIEYLKEYLELTNTLNFSTAAKNLFLSQPTLSRHIQAMEQELGFKLVTATSHGVELTETGKNAIRPFQKIVKEYQAFLERSKNLSRQISGTLVLGLLYYAIDDHFSDFLPYFMEKYPNIRLNCKPYQPQALYEDLTNGKVDVASLLDFRHKFLDNVRFQDIGTCGQIAIMREDNPLCTQESVTLRELSEYPLIELTGDDYSNALTRLILKEHNFRFEKILKTENIETVPFIVRTTGGIHITGESCKKQNAASLVYKPISDRTAVFHFGLACMEDNQNPLIDLLFKEMQQYLTQNRRIPDHS